MNSRFFFSVLLSGSIVTPLLAGADEPALPGSGYVATRYEALWSKSPFSVASAEDGPTSPDYSLVGIAQFDGVSYATVVNKQTQEHFLLSSDKPVKGFTLVSVTRGHDPSSTMAMLQKDGQSMTLKLDVTPVAPMPSMVNNFPGMNNNGGGIPLPPGVVPMPGNQPGNQPPMPYRRRERIIHIPPPPGQAMPAQSGQSPIQPWQQQMQPNPNQQGQPGQQVQPNQPGQTNVPPPAP